MIPIVLDLSVQASVSDVTKEPKFSGKDGTGARLPRRATDSELHNETREEFKHKRKRRNRKLKRDLAIPYETSVEPHRMFVRKENWLGRLERDPAPKRSRMLLGGPKGKLGTLK